MDIRKILVILAGAWASDTAATWARRQGLDQLLVRLLSFAAGAAASAAVAKAI